MQHCGRLLFFSGDYKRLLILFSVVVLCLFMYTFIALHSTPSGVASVCVYLLVVIINVFAFMSGVFVYKFVC
jgi:drug/metabolite transporter (DMT)-like permease